MKSLIAFMIMSSTLLYSQTDEDAVRPFINEFGPGARAMAMGGAYSAIAEDFTATYWNPAGLAQIRKMEFYGGLSHFNLSNRIGYSGTTTTSSNGFTNLNAVGMVFPIPTSRGSLVFALGYSRINHFDDFNQVIGSPLIGTAKFNQNERTTSEGNLDQWSFAGAVDLTKHLSVGGSLNLIAGHNEVSVNYFENDPNDVVLDRSTFTADFAVKPKYSGVNLKLGALLRPDPNFRFAMVFTSPTSLSVEENSNYADLLVDDSLRQSVYSENNFLKYDITSPPKLELGASYKYKILTVSSGVEFISWSQTRFNSNILNSDDQNIDGNINTSFLTKYRTTTNFKLGAETIIPNLGIKILGGYYSQQSPYKTGVERVNSDRQYLSAGLSFLMDEQVKIDLAYQYGWWKRSTTDDLLGSNLYEIPYVTNEKITSKKLMISMSYRF